MRWLVRMRAASTQLALRQRGLSLGENLFDALQTVGSVGFGGPSSVEGSSLMARDPSTFLLCQGCGLTFGALGAVEDYAPVTPRRHRGPLRAHSRDAGCS